MQADPERLLDLLRRWEGHWRAVDAPVVGLLQEGLSDREIDDLTAPLGLRLPVEARVLFRWHNGSLRVPGVGRDIGPRFAFQALEQAVTTTRWLRDFAIEVAQTDPDQLVWEQSWFAIMSGIIDASTIYLDTAVVEGESAPTGLTDNEETKQSDSARTFTDILAMWVQCLDEGIYTWSAEDQKWYKPWPPPAHIPPLFHDYYI